MNKYSIKNEKGFTLIEMLVSMFIFTLLVFAVIGVYITFNNSQIRTTASQQLLNDSQYAMELMTREIRNNAIVKYSLDNTICNDLIGTGDVDDVFDECIILERPNSQVFAFSSHINTTISNDKKLLYVLLNCDATYSNCDAINLSSNSVIEVLSAGLNNININALNFYITPNSDPFVSGGPNQQPKVTISMATSYLSGNRFEQVNNIFQTTVSSRVYRR